jgi:hypothetical protein
MGQRDLVTTARIRQELRERLMAERVEGVWEILGRFAGLAERHPELGAEVDRWWIRFELLRAEPQRTFSFVKAG